MRRLNASWLCAACSVITLAGSGALWAQSSEPDRNRPVEQMASSELPDSPGAVFQQQGQNQPPAASSQPGSSSLPQPPADGNPPAAPAQSADQKPQRPVGTAAAEAAPVSGITAAQPAGVAVAPAKQHRVRSIVLKVGAIVGAGAAVGAVVALSEATSSKPPGAH
jgi:hypothetical protein